MEEWIYEEPEPPEILVTFDIAREVLLPKFQCDIGTCRRTFSTSFSLKRHKKDHGGKIKCPDCADYLIPSSLYNHRKLRHDDQKDFNRAKYAQKQKLSRQKKLDSQRALLD